MTELSGASPSIIYFSERNLTQFSSTNTNKTINLACLSGTVHRFMCAIHGNRFTF